ncbi:MAG: hypothetical protein ABSH24_16810, partial [Bryobacteraceae bacterium]
NLVWFLHSDSPFLGKRKLLLAYQGCERRVATFYDLPGIPCAGSTGASLWFIICPTSTRIIQQLRK